jgi:hypothetical protein
MFGIHQRELCQGHAQCSDFGPSFFSCLQKATCSSPLTKGHVPPLALILLILLSDVLSLDRPPTHYRFVSLSVPDSGTTQRVRAAFLLLIVLSATARAGSGLPLPLVLLRGTRLSLGLSALPITLQDPTRAVLVCATSPSLALALDPASLLGQTNHIAHCPHPHLASPALLPPHNLAPDHPPPLPRSATFLTDLHLSHLPRLEHHLMPLSAFARSCVLLPTQCTSIGLFLPNAVLPSRSPFHSSDAKFSLLLSSQPGRLVPDSGTATPSTSRFPLVHFHFFPGSQMTCPAYSVSCSPPATTLDAGKCYFSSDFRSLIATPSFLDFAHHFAHR